jgi:hypothetical protein
VSTDFGRATEHGHCGLQGTASFRRIVRQADPAIFRKARKAVPTREHIVDRLGDGGRAREPGALAAQPSLQFIEERLAPFLAPPLPLFGAEAVDVALDVAQAPLRSREA